MDSNKTLINGDRDQQLQVMTAVAAIVDGGP